MNRLPSDVLFDLDGMRQNFHDGISNELMGQSFASIEGNALVYATLWPSFDPGSTFITLQQTLNLDVPCSIHSSATITFYIKVFVSSSGFIGANATMATLSVDSPGASRIIARLKPYLTSGFEAIDYLIAQTFQSFSSVKLNSVCLLPGTNPTNNVLDEGNAKDGVALVLGIALE